MKLSKVFFALFIFLTILSVFLFWLSGENGPTLIAAIISLCLAVFLGLVCFIMFLRKKSLAGGLFLTTAISTAVFLGTSQFIGFVLPPVMAAGVVMGDDPAATGGGLGLVMVLAQVGLFAIWFAFLLFTIKAYTRPVGKINKVLQKILDGEKINRVRIGKSKQYREIEKTLAELSKKSIVSDSDNKMSGGY